MRPIPACLTRTYEYAKATPSDINEHLELLRELGNECDHITEMGMRNANGSTVAFLAAQPKKLISWDINPLSIYGANAANLMSALIKSEDNQTLWEPRVGNTLEIITEPTDLLFIDTLHTARQLKAELERHADPVEKKVKKYLVFHDTQTFGMRGEDGSEPGLRMAIRWFQKDHAFPLWQLLHDRQNNNGLVVLKRVYG